MPTDTVSPSGTALDVVATAAVVVGVLVHGYGLWLVQQSALGGGWVAAIGLSLVLSGLFATEWVGDRFGLSKSGRQRLALLFALLAVVLLVLFVTVNFATFEAGEMEGSS